MTAVRIPDHFQETFERLREGTATDDDWQNLKNALVSGAVVLTGERAVAIGGSAVDSVIVTGNDNTIYLGTDPASLALTSALPMISSDFQQVYLSSLTQAIDFLHNLSLYPDREKRLALHALLQIVRSVVVTYFPDKGGLEINANVMVALPASATMNAEDLGLVFVDPQRSLESYQRILAVAQWAHPSHCSPRPLAFPVDGDPVWVLFGAPKAFLTGAIQIIGDIRREAELATLLQGQPPRIADSVRDYFRNRASFRSFACWRLMFGGTPVGVLNIQSSKPDTFGENNLHGSEFIGYIRPFCSVLGAVVRSLGDINSEPES